MLRRFSISLLPLCLSFAFFTACSARVGYRVYDPGYNDYHVWDNGEIGYYGRWQAETHHEHVDYRKLNRDDQNAYWKWRHDNH